MNRNISRAAPAAAPCCHSSRSWPEQQGLRASRPTVSRRPRTRSRRLPGLVGAQSRRVPHRRLRGNDPQRRHQVLASLVGQYRWHQGVQLACGRLQQDARRIAVYVGNQSGEFDAFNATTGNSCGSTRFPSRGLSKEIEPSPAVYQNVVYFADGNPLEYALNATTGALLCTSGSWADHLVLAIIGNPDGRVLSCTSATPASAVTATPGWRPSLGDVRRRQPDGAACSMRWVFDDFGSPAGSQTGKAGVYSSPAYYTFTNGVPVVVVGSTDNDDSIYEINASTGAAIWRFQTLTGVDADVGAPPTIAVPGTSASRIRRVHGWRRL